MLMAKRLCDCPKHTAGVSGNGAAHCWQCACIYTHCQRHSIADANHYAFIDTYTIANHHAQPNANTHSDTIANTDSITHTDPTIVHLNASGGR